MASAVSGSACIQVRSMPIPGDWQISVMCGISAIMSYSFLLC